MKKISVFVAAALILTAPGPRSAAAQVTLVPGVKGGLSISTFGEPWSTLKGPAAGAFLSIGLNKVLSVQPEVFWLTQGGAALGGYYYDELGNYVEIEDRWTLSYVHIPVLCKLYPIPKGTFRPVLFAGPAFDILVRAVQAEYLYVYDDQGKELGAHRGDDVNISAGSSRMRTFVGPSGTARFGGDLSPDPNIVKSRTESLSVSSLGSDPSEMLKFT